MNELLAVALCLVALFLSCCAISALFEAGFRHRISFDTSIGMRSVSDSADPKVLAEMGWRRRQWAKKGAIAAGVTFAIGLPIALLIG